MNMHVRKHLDKVRKYVFWTILLKSSHGVHKRCHLSSQEAAAMVLVACLVLGVGLGSVISYGTVSLL